MRVRAVAALATLAVTMTGSAWAQGSGNAPAPVAPGSDAISPNAAANSAGGAAAVEAASAPVKALDRPWAKGVPPERQEAALRHLQEGNNLLKDALFLAAARKYREALADWDHPGIHYNLALALLNLDQPVEVYENLESAVRFGPGPLEPDKLERAKSYLALIEKQVASIDVRCDHEGADVTLDGAHIFTAPGRYQKMVRAGAHTVTASKPGFTTTARTETFPSGRTSVVELKLYTAGDLIEYRRRWPIARPITVVAVGTAILAAGLVFTLEARSRFSSYDNTASNTNCIQMSGCVPGSPDGMNLANLKQQGDRFNTLATISYAVGGTALATGVVLLLVDKSVAYRIDPNGGERRDTAALSPVAPFVAPGAAGLVASGRF
jgi:hypothetical protein